MALSVTIAQQSDARRHGDVFFKRAQIFSARRE
jgi:hypothetical protein